MKIQVFQGFEGKLKFKIANFEGLSAKNEKIEDGF